MLDVYKANRRETGEPVFPSQAHDFAGSELVITEALRTPDITKQSLLCSKFLLFQPENSLLPILVFTCFLKTRIEAWRHEARQTGHWSPRPPSSGHTLSSLCTCGPGAPAGPHAPRGPVGRNPAVCVDFCGKVCRTRSLWRSNDSGGVFVQGASGRSVSQRRSPARVRAPSQGTLACPRGPGGRPVNVCLTGE